MKNLFLRTSLAALLALSTISFAAEQATPTTDMNSADLTTMNDQMQLMRDQMTKIRNAKTPDERQKLMQEHMGTVQQHMGSMCGSMSGMMGNRMNGSDEMKGRKNGNGMAGCS